jgi:3-oxoacyl-[acyl-carrier-protein] synthase II
MGAVASVGRSAPEIYARLCAGASGLAPLRGFTRRWYRAGHLFEVDNRRQPGHDEPRRATALLLDAVGQAIDDAGLIAPLTGVPVLVGTGLRELRSVELWWRDGLDVSASDLHFGTALARRFGAHDTHTFANACSASLYALAYGLDILALGAADTVVVAGVDVITESMFGLSDRVQPEPPGRVAPFDRSRRGTILGEGAAAIVLQRDTHGPHYGRVRQVGVNCDAFHPTAPDPESVAGAMRDAHKRAGVKPADVDLVMLHGTGTPLNDEAEAAALRTVFAGDVTRPWMTGLKSMTGHTSGASGLLSLIVALYAMRHGTIPPMTQLADPVDAAADFRFVRQPDTGGQFWRPPSSLRAGVDGPLRVAQIDGFGFGGVNAVAVVESGRA